MVANVRALAPRAFSECHAWDIIEVAWSLERLNDARVLLKATVPPPQSTPGSDSNQTKSKTGV
jgi:hypothetical protein